MTELVVGSIVIIKANPIHRKLEGKTGTVVAFSAGDKKYPVTRNNRNPATRNGGNPIVKLPVIGKFLFRAEDLEVMDE